MTGASMIRFYADEFPEADRLEKSGHGRLEFLRTQHIIGQRLQDRPMRIADVGGGPGRYARWLAGLGHDVELIDPVANHVRQALTHPTGPGSITASVGDARDLEFPDASVDAVLLLGPLYHLPEPGDREVALAEARRTLRPGGVLFAAAISRFSSFHDGLTHGWLRDPDFATIVRSDLETGHHRNPTNRPGWFTDSYFHRPDELRAEVVDAGFGSVSVHGLEGLAGWLPDLDAHLDDDVERTQLLEWLDRIGTEPAILGVSAHLLACAVKQL